MNLTTKQLSILRVLIAGNGTDTSKKFTPVDLDQLIERLDYEPTKQSIQFSIRALIGMGLIAKGEREQRRGRSRVTLQATDAGRSMVSFGANPSFSAAREIIPGLSDLHGLHDFRVTPVSGVFDLPPGAPDLIPGAPLDEEKP